MRSISRARLPLLALLVAAAPAQAQLVKMATLVPDGSSWHRILKETAEKWRVLSGGKINVRLYAGGVAGDDPDVVRKMRLGTLNASVLTAVGVAENGSAVGLAVGEATSDEPPHAAIKTRTVTSASNFLIQRHLVKHSGSCGRYVTPVT